LEKVLAEARSGEREKKRNESLSGAATGADGVQKIDARRRYVAPM